MNKYEVIKTIGEGAYGVVLQCRNKESGDLVAIKRFKESDEDELVRKTTLREVKILRLLKDEPFVVRLQEAFRRKGKLYLVCDYVGCNLLDVLEQYPQGLDSEDVRRMVFTMILGVRACHINSVIHRDIKPENLLVHPDDRTLRLCDFGFARIYSPDMEDLTDYVATRWYRAPELLLGTTNYGLPSDVWAMGCIMAELIDGQALFPGETEVDQIFMIQKLLGNYTPQQVEIFRKNTRFQGYTLKDVTRTETTLERKFNKKTSKKAISLLKSMLVIDPAKRCTVEEAIQHPYFEGLIDEYCPQLRNITPAIRPASGAPARPPSTRVPSATAGMRTETRQGYMKENAEEGNTGSSSTNVGSSCASSSHPPNAGILPGVNGEEPRSNSPTQQRPLMARLGSASRQERILAQFSQYQQQPPVFQQAQHGLPPQQPPLHPSFGTAIGQNSGSNLNSGSRAPRILPTHLYQQAAQNHSTMSNLPRLNIGAPQSSFGGLGMGGLFSTFGNPYFSGGSSSSLFSHAPQQHQQPAQVPQPQQGLGSSLTSGSGSALMQQCNAGFNPQAQPAPPPPSRMTGVSGTQLPPRVISGNLPFQPPSYAPFDLKAGFMPAYSTTMSSYGQVNR